MVKRWTHRSKLIVTCCLVFSLLASVMWAPQTGQAETELEKIRREIEAARERIEQAKENAQKAQSDLRKIQHEKEQVKEEINKLTEDIDKAVARLQQLEKNIEQQEAELRQTEERLQEIALRIQERDRLLRSRLRLMYTNGAVTYLEVLLQSTSFADFLDRFNLLKSLVSQDKEMLEAHERDRSAREEEKAKMESLLAGLEKDHMEAEMLRRSLLEQRKEREVRIASLNSEQLNLEHYLEEEEEALMKAAEKEQELQDREKQLEAQYKGGKLAYPLPRIYPVTSGFGSRVDPITGASGAFHGGIDFGAPGGTNVLAAHGGSVLVAEWYGGYGNTVILNHGNGLWTVYAHMRNNSLAVKKGDTVERGQKLGEVGTTGRSTGNHLHFEVRLNGEKVNPREYLNLD